MPVRKVAMLTAGGIAPCLSSAVGGLIERYTDVAPDVEIMEWARQNGQVVFTHDLDFGALLASTGASGPSVVQLRCEDTRPTSMGEMVVAAMQSQLDSIQSGALVTIDPRRMRLSILPLQTS